MERMENTSSHAVRSWVCTLAQVNRTVDDAFANLCKLNMTHIRILLLLAKLPDAPGVSRLAQLLMIKPSSVTNAVNQLEARGFVKRVEKPEDKRAGKVVLEPAGIACAESALERFEELLDQFYNQIPGASEERLRKLAYDFLVQPGRAFAQVKIDPSKRVDRALLHLSFMSSSYKLIDQLTKVPGALGLTEYRCLAELLHAQETGRSLCSRDLVGLTGINRSYIATSIQNLEDRGLIVKVNNPRDQRSSYLEPTAGAQEQLEVSTRQFYEVLVTLYGATFLAQEEMMWNALCSSDVLRHAPETRVRRA